ncbi:CIC11C00000005153 [Sungouiella intermedia]|uniref:CIC11C00000005153 n=1 Tax=Sungouiella intermedia TaxID=45354 RepID=A0A1L0BWE0_9ASCO|nr:CIC11C00000005153 [[Candida] intermedia]
MILHVKIGSKLSSLKFPDSVEILDLSDCDIESLEGFEFPVSLIELKLQHNRILELKNLKFPERLRVLNVNFNETKTFYRCDFPNLFRELDAYGNCFINLVEVTFPELEVLEISARSKGKIKNFRSFDFPSTLKVLQADSAFEDLWRTSFPKGLRELEVTVKGGHHRLCFPSALESLKLTFPKSCKSKFSHLDLPVTLLELEITNGKCIEFDWKLPYLQKLVLKNFKGQIITPPSVESLSISVEIGKWLKGISITQRLEQFEINCLHGQFDKEIDVIIESQSKRKQCTIEFFI